MSARRTQTKSPALPAPVLAALLFFPGVPSPVPAEVACLQLPLSGGEKASNLGDAPRRSGLRCIYDLLACLQHRIV